MDKHYIAFEDEKLQKVIDRLDSIEKRLDGYNDKSNEIFSTEQVCKILGVSVRTLQKYRDHEKIGFTQTVGKVFYTSKDINDFVKRYHNSAGGVSARS